MPDHTHLTVVTDRELGHIVPRGSNFLNAEASHVCSTQHRRSRTID